LRKWGNPTGTAYVRVRKVSDDSILGTIGTIDVSTLTTSSVWYDFTGSVSNPTQQDLRFTVEYSGGSSSNHISVSIQEPGTLGGAVLTEYITSWSDHSGKDAAFKVYFEPGTRTVTATGVSSGKHIINVWADGTNFGLDVDGTTEDTVALGGASVCDNGNDWVLSNIPYMDYYTHTTSDTLRVTYAPDSIISGTTLPNEESPGTYDGTITWGSNPAGISISTSGLRIEESYYYTGGEISATDIFEPEPAELAPGQDSDKLDHNPLKPGVEGFVEASNGAFTESLVWYGIAWFSIIAVGIALIILVREHLVFAAAVAFGLSIFWYVNGVLDYWVLIILGILLGASLINEKQPTW